MTNEICTPLLDWFADNKRSLPWRRDRDAYHVWLSEIMLQQTRVEAVIPYYERFLAVCPTVQARPGCVSCVAERDHAPADPGGSGDSIL